MKNYTILTLLLFWTAILSAQTVERKGKETIQQFSERLKPKNSSVTHEVLETKWNAHNVIIALYDQTYVLPVENDPEQQTNHKIIGSIYIQLEKNTYRKTNFGTIDTEGGNPHIESVFFANADKDMTKELVIIASWEQRHYDFNGTLYGTFVFDYHLKSTKTDWKFLDKISSKLDGGCDCYERDGTNRKARFKTAGAVRKELARLGYKQ